MSQLLADDLLDQVASQIVTRVMARLETATKPEPSTAAPPLATSSDVNLSLGLRAWLKYHAGANMSSDERMALNRLGIAGDREVLVPLNLTGAITRADQQANLVPTRIGDAVVESLSQYNAVRSVATVISTTTAENLRLPIVDDRANQAALLTTSGVDMTTGVSPTISSISLGVYTLQSGLVPVHFGLIRDSAVDIEQVLGRVIGERLGRKANELETTGTGTNEPQGILAAAPIAVTAASATAIDWKELVDLVSYVDPAERVAAAWMMHPTTLAAISKLTDDHGRPLFWPDLTGAGPGRLLGYPVVENPNMPTIATGAKVIVFGNLKRYVIREVANIRLRILQERLVEFDAIGMLAFYDFDAALHAAATTKALGVLKMA